MTLDVVSGRASHPTLTSTARFDHLLDILTHSMNALHGTDFSKRFWGILLYRYLCKCVRVHQEQLPVPMPPAYIHSDDAILERKVSEATEDETQSSARDRIYALLKEGVRTLQAMQPVRGITARRTLAANGVLVTGFHRYEVITRHLPQLATRLRVQKANWSPFGVTAKRRRLATLRGEAEDPLIKLALDWLPAWYVEEFDPIHQGIPVPRTSSAQIHASFLSSIEVRMAVAKHVQAGAGLTVYQHSAGYGEIKGHLLHHAESSLADRFMTWGWKLNAADTPFLALRLMNTRVTVAEHDRVGPWLYVIGRQPTPTNVNLTLSIQRRFFSRLSEMSAQRIVLRPRTNKGGSYRLQVSEEAKFRARGVDEGREAVQAGGASLVILDTFPTTSFMERVASGAPVIAITSPGAAFTNIATVFYEEFLRLGLLHETAESAADFLNRTVIEAWWREVRQTDCFQDYVHTFCNCDEARVVA